jgi:hypothetical protein
MSIFFDENILLFVKFSSVKGSFIW